MHRDAVLYKGSYLLPNSKCYELYQAKKWKELDELMKQTEKEAKDLLTRYK